MSPFPQGPGPKGRGSPGRSRPPSCPQAGCRRIRTECWGPGGPPGWRTSAPCPTPTPCCMRSSASSPSCPTCRGAQPPTPSWAATCSPRWEGQAPHPGPVPLVHGRWGWGSQGLRCLMPGLPIGGRRRVVHRGAALGRTAPHSRPGATPQGSPGAKHEPPADPCQAPPRLPTPLRAPSLCSPPGAAWVDGASICPPAAPHRERLWCPS